MRFWAWLLSLLSPPPPPPPPPEPEPPPDPGLAQSINRVRAARGKPTMKPDPRLDAVAQQWAESMLRTGVFDHGDFAGRIATVYPNSPSAENIAEGQWHSADVVAAWLASPAHRDNMLGPYTRVGVGRAGPFWVADFALLR